MAVPDFSIVKALLVGPPVVTKRDYVCDAIQWLPYLMNLLTTDAVCAAQNVCSVTRLFTGAVETGCRAFKAALAVTLQPPLAQLWLIFVLTAH